MIGRKSINASVAGLATAIPAAFDVGAAYGFGLGSFSIDMFSRINRTCCSNFLNFDHAISLLGFASSLTSIILSVRSKKAPTERQTNYGTVDENVQKRRFNQTHQFKPDPLIRFLIHVTNFAEYRFAELAQKPILNATSNTPTVPFG